VFQLKPHQETAVGKMCNGCILCGGTGVGKTHAAIAYYMRNEAPRPVFVITTAKKRDKFDWQMLWGSVGMHEDPELTMSATVKVDSWENIKKYEGVKDAFFIFDEQRLVGTGTWVKTFYKIAAANRWVMLSATPGDNWLDYVPVFRANGFIKNITQFRDDHCVYRWTGRYNQLIGYRQVPRLVKWRNQLLVDMPYEKHTTRHLHDVAVEYDKDLVKELVNKRWHVYENRPLTDASELFRVMRTVVYSDTTRLSAVRALLKKHPKLIVFYNFDYELEILRTLADTQWPDSQAESQLKSTSPKNSTSSSVEESSLTSPSEMTENPNDSQNQSLISIASDASTLSNETTKESLTSYGKSPTHSGITSSDLKPAGSISKYTESLDPWDYLLSPEGLRENKTLTPGNGNTSAQESRSTSPEPVSSSVRIVASLKMAQSETDTDSQHTSGSPTTPTRMPNPTNGSSHSRSGEEENLRDSLLLIENPMVLSPEESGICLITDGPRSGYGKSSERKPSAYSSAGSQQKDMSTPSKTEYFTHERSETNQCAEQSENHPDESSTGTESSDLSSLHELPEAPSHRVSQRKTSRQSSKTDTAPSDTNSQVSKSTHQETSHSSGAETISNNSSERPSGSTGSSQTTTHRSNVGLSEECLRRLETLRTAQKTGRVPADPNGAIETLRTASPDRPPHLLREPGRIETNKESNGTSTETSPSTQEISMSSESTGGLPHAPDEHCETSSRTLQQATDEPQKETECLEKADHHSSSTPRRKTSTSYEHRTDGYETERPTGRNESSTSPSTTKTSSTQSSTSQDHSLDGRSSTSSQAFQVAEWNGHKHEAVPTTTSWVYLVQYVAGAEAWECTDTDAMVLWSPPYSYKKYDQALGRIDRLNTPFYDLHYYRLMADSPIDKAVFDSLRAQKDFNEKGLRDAMWASSGE
jgi:hypothetical protein